MTTYRRASRPELQLMLDWAQEEGWNPGKEDVDAFYAADPKGFFVAVEGAQPIAGISVVNHSPGFAFLGLYIVRPAYRGRGIGLALWQQALEHAGSRVVGLDGVPEQQANYAASGFVHAGATTRFSGDVLAQADLQVALAGAADLEDLLAREAACSGQEKRAYLSAWFQPRKTRQTLVLREPGRIAGFATARQCASGTKIGPLSAAAPQAAERLLRHAATLWPGPVVVDVPESAAPLAELCKGLGLEAGFQTARMYRGPFEARAPKIFAVTSLELG